MCGGANEAAASAAICWTALARLAGLMVAPPAIPAEVEAEAAASAWVGETEVEVSGAWKPVGEESAFGTLPAPAARETLGAAAPAMSVGASDALAAWPAAWRPINAAELPLC